MALSDRITSWLVDTITIAAPSGVSNYGDPTFGAQSTLSARVEKKESIVLDINGNERRVAWQVASLTAIALNSRVWLPGDDTADNTEARRPVSIESATTKPSTYGSTDTTLYMTYFE